MITYPCPKCGQEISIESPSSGRSARCQKCGTISDVPDTLSTPHAKDDFDNRMNSLLTIPKNKKAGVEYPHSAKDEFNERLFTLQRMALRVWLVLIVDMYFLARIEPVLGIELLKTIGTTLIIPGFMAFAGIAMAVIYVRVDFLGILGLIHIGDSDHGFWASQKRVILLVLSFVVLAEIAILFFG